MNSKQPPEASTRAPLHGLRLRTASEADLAAITSIYAQAVLHGTGTFELQPPSQDEMAARRAEVLARGLPYLVAERNGQVLGYAYANWFRPRAAYQYCVEDSIYLDAQARGQGLGQLLLAELVARATQAGARQMVAVIGDSENQASIGLHRSLGFESAGLLKQVGWKFGRWLDVVMMQRSLGPGAALEAQA